MFTLSQEQLFSFRVDPRLGRLHIQVGNKEAMIVVFLCKMTGTKDVYSNLLCFHAVAGDTGFFLFGQDRSGVGFTALLDSISVCIGPSP